jgi:hypothetical protein
MRHCRTWCGVGTFLLLVAGGLVPATAASASKHKSTHHKAKKGTAKHATKDTSPGNSQGNLASLHCPKQSLVTSAAGTTFTGPNPENGGTAACIYADAAGNELNVIMDSPNESRRAFVSTDPSDIGEPATAVSGVGKAAFSTTTYGHAEVDVYESASKGFAVTLDPVNGNAVTPADLTQVLAVAHSIAAG